MTKLWKTLFRSRTAEVSRYSLDQYAADRYFTYGGIGYPLGQGSSTAWAKTEDIENNFVAYCQQIYKANGVVYAVMAARRLLFKSARIMWQGFENGIEGDLFWDESLEVLRKPWPNGTMGELLSRMDQDASLGGNFYAVKETNRDGSERVRRLRPDWMTIVLTAPPSEAVKSDVEGYWFHPGRSYTVATTSGPGEKDEFYPPEEMCHWTPDPDPEAQYRGMSWLTPVIREIIADGAATKHKEKFFSNGATLGTIISAKENLTEDQFKAWMANFNASHQGVDNAYRPLFFASPVDVTVRGLDLRQLDFKTTQGHGETRVCAAGRVPPIIVGVSEGLEAATYSNYGQARRAFGDAWAHPQWEDAAGALETIVTPPDRPAKLSYAYKHIAFLREDQKDAAEIQQTKAAVITSLINAGFTPESVVAAVDADDRTLLVHTGLVSVQLQPPGQGVPTDTAAGEVPGETPAPDAGGSANDEDTQALIDAMNEAGSDASRASMWDDDEVVRALVDALDEIWRVRHVRTPAGAKKYGVPIGSPIGGGGHGKPAVLGSAKSGRRTLKDRLVDAIRDHLDNNREGHPFADFDREQLRRVAKARGIDLGRGEDRDSIAAKLLADLRGDNQEPDAPSKPKPRAAAASKPKAPKKPTARAVPNDAGGNTRVIRSESGEYRQITPDQAEVMQADMLAGEAWSKEQESALAAYTGNDYRGINDRLRGRSKGDTFDGTIEQIRSALRPTPQDLTVHRSVAADALGFPFGRESITLAEGKKLVGRTFHDRGFTSTSVEPLKGGNVVQLRISVPAGAKAAYLESLSRNRREYEVLLDAGTHFKIERAATEAGKTVLYLTVVGQDD